MFKFLHLADVHLDTTFLGRSDEVRQRLRSALRTAFERAVDCALEERVDALLIAGDLFDGERLSFTTERFLLTQCGRLEEAGIACFYATGNHDPGGSRFRASHMEWPENVRCIDTREPRTIHVNDASGTERFRVVAAGHTSPHEQANLAAAFPHAEDGVPHVGLLHTFVTSAASVDDHDRYAPCSVEDLRDKGYAYWALGHLHQHQQVDQSVEAWYAGSLQGSSPAEPGPRGGLLVTLDRNRAPQVEFRAFAPVEWLTIYLDQLEDVQTFRALLRRVRQSFEEGKDESHGVQDWLLRICLEGSCPLASELADEEQRGDLERALAHELSVLDVEVQTEKLHPPVVIDRYRGETHLIGEVLALIDRVREQDDLLESVAPDALAADTANAEARHEYLRSLLEELDEEAVTRLLIEGEEARRRAS